MVDPLQARQSVPPRAAHELTRLAKRRRRYPLLVGHVTKRRSDRRPSGASKNMFDTRCLYFEGERGHQKFNFRIPAPRSKNRFAGVYIIGVLRK